MAAYFWGEKADKAKVVYIDPPLDNGIYKDHHIARYVWPTQAQSELG